MSFGLNSEQQLCLAMGTAKERPILEFLKDYSHPFYLYDLNHMVARAQFWQKTFSGVQAHYAMKANSHPDILKAFHKIGMKIDVVSGGEIRAAQSAGFSGPDMIFSGVGKTADEIRLSLEIGLGQINVESPQELERIGQIAKQTGRKAAVAFRMNPDVNAKTHPYITTGFRENKFGMDETFLPELLAILKRHPELQLKGLTLHIGSQLLDMAPLEEALGKTIAVWQGLRAQGYQLETFDFGGGIGIHYTSGEEALELQFAREYGTVVKRLLGPLGCRLLCEPGRFLVARGGALISQVQYIKSTRFKRFCILDSGMNHLLRPTLYEAYHRIEPVLADRSRPRLNYDVVGPICESSDFYAKDRELQEIHAGDFMAILDVGAYGAAMANHYNLHPLPLEVIS